MGPVVSLCYAEYQVVDQHPCSGHLVFDLHNEQWSFKTRNLRQIGRKVAGFAKGDIEKQVTDSKNTRSRILSPQAAIENEIVVTIPDSIMAGFPVVGGPEIQTVVTPEYSPTMAANGLGKETVEIGKVDLRKTLADLLKIETRYVSQYLSDSLYDISSGGKDSQAMTILLSRIVPREQIIVIHAPLGEVEWPGTIEHIEDTLPDGVPLILAPVTSGKSLLDSIEERGRFPSPWVRWCASSLKRGLIERELRRYLKTHTRLGRRLVNAMGMRAEESVAQAVKLP